jgi:pimeloyl-ACP methyl ester carboxylesterase
MQAIIILFLITSLVIFLTILAIHIGFHPPRRVESGTPADSGMTYRAVSIDTHGGKRLFAWWLPAAAPSPTAILLHGWGANAELMLPLALPLHRAGLNLLLLDARNHGRSDRALFSSLPRFAQDAGEAVTWVKKRTSEASGRIVLVGHSVGGGAVLFEASRRRDISAVISIAAFAHPEWMMRRYLRRLRMPEPFIRMILRYIEWIIGHRYEEIAPMRTACQITCPVLLVHGTADRTVPLSDALTILNSCHREGVELLTIEDADHDSVDKVEEHGEKLVDFLVRAGIVDKCVTRTCA